MGKKRNQYSPEFKSKVVLVAIRNEETVDETTANFNIQTTMINNRQRALLNGVADLFDKGQKTKKNHAATVDELCKTIGQLKVEYDFFVQRDRFLDPSCAKR